jgi:hypothetical protein
MGAAAVIAVTPTKPERAADERLVILHRAHARLILFENGLMSLDEAAFGLLENYCPCSRERKTA